MVSEDVDVYQETGRWHYQILQLMEGSAGSSVPIYLSQADNRHGYCDEAEARKAGIAYKATLPQK